MKDVDPASIPVCHRGLTKIDFAEVSRKAKAFADEIIHRRDDLIEILLEYESYQVASDEISRTIDLLNNLHENSEYFKIKVGEIASFLPRNQPVYALTCFVIVPSFLTTVVHFRVPEAVREILPRILDLLKFDQLIPNARVSSLGRLEFLRERSAILRDRLTGQTRPVTEAVIFTGTPHHADQLRRVFDKRTLFIANGAGHNPIVVGSGADLSAAVEATLEVSLYNQGQDCAAPNSVLVLENEYEDFMDILRHRLSLVSVGEYKQRRCRVGPISNPRVRTRSRIIART